jgi:hypothetical protein
VHEAGRDGTLGNALSCASKGSASHAIIVALLSVATFHRPRRARQRSRSIPACEFDTWTGPVKGASATAEVLLPIAAVAVGMTVLGLVFHIIASGGA